MYKPTYTLTLAFLALVLALFLASPTAAAQAATDDQVVTTAVAYAQQSRAEEYWTRERMAAAQPIAFPTPVAGAFDGAMPQARGEELTVEGGPPDRGMNALARRTYPEEWLAEIDSPGGWTPEGFLGDFEEDFAAASSYSYTYPPPYTFYGTNAGHMWKHYPWRTIGKLFFTKPSGSTGYCSASVAVGRAVWTAGHCVYTPGSGWHTNMTFVPAYRSGSRPYGTFTVTRRATLSGWINGKQAYDIAMVVVADKRGRKVSQWVGWLGARFNASTKQFWHANGYPSEFLSGERLYVCEASLSSRWSLPGPDPVGMGCRMRWGSSGGPWIAKFVPYASGPRNYVNSVVSGSPTPSKLHEFFGPYFGSGAVALYDWGKTK